MSTGLLTQPKRAFKCQGKGRKILIIEDDLGVAESLACLLERMGFQASWVTHGETGLAFARTEHPDVIILDLCLPDMDGLAVCERLADGHETCDIPIIVVSGWDREDILRLVRSAGGSYYLRKPYDPKALVVLIEHTLREVDSWRAVSMEDEEGGMLLDEEGIYPADQPKDSF
jgi:DNA-binding response OmpR family regulator